MPKTPIDYSKTHFYKLVCNDTNIKDMYIGHTTEFTKRRYQHKIRCCDPNNSKHNLKVYKFIRDNGHWDNWNMILIDTLKCEGRLDALKKEREIFEELKPSLNIFRPMRTDDERKNYQKEHYQKNIERISERHRQYRNDHAEQYKQDRKDNPEKYKALDRQNYLKRPPEYFEKQSRKIDCSCGGRYSVSSKSDHFKTKKHQQYLQSQLN